MPATRHSATVALGRSETLSTLLVRVGADRCALRVADVVETLRPRPVSPIADAPPFVAGMAVVRGAPAPVVDLGALIFGRPCATPGRWVTVHAGARTVALQVDAVDGVHALDGAALAGLPPLLAQARADVIAAVGALDASLLLVLSTARLWPEGFAETR